MGCTGGTALTDVTYDCSDKPKGGIEQILVMHKSNLSSEVLAAGELDLAASVISSGDVIEIDFNKKDGFTYAGMEYSGEPDGTDSFVPTVSVQAPRITLDKLQAVGVMTGGFNELLVFVKMKTGIEICHGYDSGVFVNSANTNSGNNTEKNTIEFTFSGEEDSFEKVLASGSWAILEAALA